jgi:hypothetical protein
MKGPACFSEMSVRFSVRILHVTSLKPALRIVTALNTSKLNLPCLSVSSYIHSWRTIGHFPEIYNKASIKFPITLSRNTFCVYNCTSPPSLFLFSRFIPSRSNSKAVRVYVCSSTGMSTLRCLHASRLRDVWKLIQQKLHHIPVIIIFILKSTSKRQTTDTKEFSHKHEYMQYICFN